MPQTALPCSAFVSTEQSKNHHGRKKPSRWRNLHLGVSKLQTFPHPNRSLLLLLYSLVRNPAGFVGRSLSCILMLVAKKLAWNSWVRAACQAEDVLFFRPPPGLESGRVSSPAVVTQLAKTRRCFFLWDLPRHRDLSKDLIRVLTWRYFFEVPKWRDVQLPKSFKEMDWVWTFLSASRLALHLESHESFRSMPFHCEDAWCFLYLKGWKWNGYFPISQKCQVFRVKPSAVTLLPQLLVELDGFLEFR